LTSKWIWIVISGLAWPGVQYLVAVTRFGIDNSNFGYWHALQDFGLFGLAAGWLYFFFQEQAANDRQAKITRLGYLSAIPFAYFGSLGSGLIFPGALGPIIMGSIPLLLGAWLGKLFGGMGSAG
jgi:hypothetical protein